MAKTGPTPRRMGRGNPQAIRAPARGSRRTVIITTTPDDFTAGTADITTAGTTASNLRRFIAAQSISICSVKILLAISEPSTHGGKADIPLTSRDVRF